MEQWNSSGTVTRPLFSIQSPIHKVQRDGDIGDAQHTPDHQHDHHRHDRAAQPAQNARRVV